MQFNVLLLMASLMSTALAAPVPKPHNDKSAVVNSRFITYENEARDAAPAATADEKYAVVNSRFITYEPDKRDAAPEKAVVNSRFITYEG
ncbi:MAG: hypothetical protein MMC33_010133 [Icmadophila ericetorum]|nr:hypothetical protein [Icmadophila ericetorum]